MPTNDVPGTHPANSDTLHDRCWAEAKDGSLLFLHSAENHTIVFSMFDPTKNPPLDYRHAMPQAAFEKMFDWRSKKATPEWTWHDKSSQPWDRVIKMGAQPGLHYVSADDQISAAQRVADDLKLRASKLDPDRYAHNADQEVVGGSLGQIKRAFDAAFDAFSNEMRR